MCELMHGRDLVLEVIGLLAAVAAEKHATVLAVMALAHLPVVTDAIIEFTSVFTEMI